MGRPLVLGLTETDEGREVFDTLGIIHLGAAARPVLRQFLLRWQPQLVIVCGWRRLIRPEYLEMAPLGWVGFHSAKLPEYPGRAPVPWTLVRGDAEAWTTMFYLDEGVDTGDIIDAASVPVEEGDTVESIYAKLAKADIDLLERHWDGLVTGTAPRLRQDTSKRGRLTTKDGWDRYHEMVAS